MGGAVLTDGAGEHADEFAVTPTADHQEIGPFGGFDQECGCVTLLDPSFNGLIREFATQPPNQVVQCLFSAQRRLALIRKKNSAAGVRRPIPGRDDLSCRIRQSCIGKGPLQGLN